MIIHDVKLWNMSHPQFPVQYSYVREGELEKAETAYTFSVKSGSALFWPLAFGFNAKSDTVAGIEELVETFKNEIGRKVAVVSQNVNDSYWSVRKVFWSYDEAYFCVTNQKDYGYPVKEHLYAGVNIHGERYMQTSFSGGSYKIEFVDMA